MGVSTGFLIETLVHYTYYPTVRALHPNAILNCWRHPAIFGYVIELADRETQVHAAYMLGINEIAQTKDIPDLLAAILDKLMSDVYSPYSEYCRPDMDFPG